MFRGICFPCPYDPRFRRFIPSRSKFSLMLDAGWCERPLADPRAKKADLESSIDCDVSRLTEYLRMTPAPTVRFAPSEGSPVPYKRPKRAVWQTRGKSRHGNKPVFRESSP